MPGARADARAGDWPICRRGACRLLRPAVALWVYHRGRTAPAKRPRRASGRLAEAAPAPLAEGGRTADRPASRSANCDAFAARHCSVALTDGRGLATRRGSPTDHLAEQFAAIVQGTAEGQAPTRDARSPPSVGAVPRDDEGRPHNHRSPELREIQRHRRRRRCTPLDAAGAAPMPTRRCCQDSTRRTPQLGIQDSTLDAAPGSAPLVVLLSTPVPSGDARRRCPAAAHTCSRIRHA